MDLVVNLLFNLRLHGLHPPQRGMYKEIIKERWFLDSRPWVLKNITAFDRCAYVDALLTQHDYLPEEFKMWVLEWPSKAVFGGIWPGLPPNIHDLVGSVGPAGRLDGWNLLDFSKPVVRVVNCIDDNGFNENASTNRWFIHPMPGIPVILVSGNEITWILLGKERYRDQIVKTFVSQNEFRSYGLNLEEDRWDTWVDCLWLRIGILRRLHGRAEAHELPFMFHHEPSFDPIKITSLCTPWNSTSHTPFMRSVEWIDLIDEPSDDDGSS
ncbi:hypothetical protein ONZ45_g14943 [Pleurotus djamor]|nr:hypothetical protein ONZ45_g14943 [Pleurotus djamor]